MASASDRRGSSDFDFLLGFVFGRRRGGQKRSLMRRDHVVGRAAVAITTALCLGLSPGASLLAGPPVPQAPPRAVAGWRPKPASTAAPKAAPSPAPNPAPAGAASKPPATPTSTAAGRAPTRRRAAAKIVVYQPQVASWDEQRHMVAYAAVSYEAKGATKPALGSLKIEADTKVSVVRAPGQLQRPQDHGVQLPDPAKEQMREVVAEVDKAIPDESGSSASTACWPAWTAARSCPRTSRA